MTTSQFATFEAAAQTLGFAFDRQQRPTTEAECAELVRSAHDSRMFVVPVGAGTTLDAGCWTPRARIMLLRTDGMRWETDVRDADSLVVCAAGTPFAAVQDALRARHQMLALDPPCADVATMGGVVAANAFGLSRCSTGPVADHLTEARMVIGTGEAIRSGARVVKNAAGYDLCRLVTGSCGALAILTELTFRTRPCPPAQAAFAFRTHEMRSALECAWKLHQERWPLDYLAVLSEPSLADEFLVLAGASGSRAHVSRLSGDLLETMKECGLQNVEDHAPVEGAMEASRRMLHGIDMKTAGRWTGPIARVAELVPALSEVLPSWVWLVPSGMVAGGSRAAELDHGRALHRRVAARATGPHRWRVLRGEAGPGIFRRPDEAYLRILAGVKEAFDPAGILFPGVLESFR